MKCLRVHSTADGESHFDEVEIPTTSRQVHPNAAAFEVSAKYAGSGIRYRTFRRVRDRSIGIAVAPIAGPYGVRAVATDALISGNGFGSLRRSLKSSTTDRSRGRHPRLRPLKRACWSDTNHGGLAPNRPHTSHGSETSLHAYVGEQLLAGGALHSGNTSWKR
jgi:hypothetical protein